MSNFVHLHAHSEYSLLDGSIKVEKLVKRAADVGMPAVALTDHGNMFGMIHFYRAARKAGIKPILGQSDGEVVPVDKVRGGRRVHARVLELFEEQVDPARPVFVATAHASAPLWGSRLKNQVLDRFRVVEVFEGEIGPVVGAHAGPGTVGCILFQPTDEELGLLAPEPQ